MKDQVGEEIYITYIYPDTDSLYELSVREGASVSAELGEKILEVKDFHITDKGRGFLEISASDADGILVSLLVHLRSESDIVWE